MKKISANHYQHTNTSLPNNILNPKYNTKRQHTLKTHKTKRQHTLKTHNKKKHNKKDHNITNNYDPYIRSQHTNTSTSQQNSYVHCGSAFEPGASGLPYYALICRIFLPLCVLYKSTHICHFFYCTQELHFLRRIL